MARLLGPDPNSLFVYTLPGGDVYTAAGLIGTVYSDDAGTVLADIAEFLPLTPTVPGPVITSSQVTVGAESLLPFFWFPATGQEELWITVNGGPLTRIVADLEDQILSGGGGVPTTRAINTTAPLTGGGTLAADLTLGVAVGTTAGTVAAGNDPRIGAAQNLVFNVVTYGAVGDGVADDTQAILDTFTAADTAGGGTVYFPAGRYWSTGIVVANMDGFTIRADRGGVLLGIGPTGGDPNAGTANVLTLVECTNFSIMGVTIDGQRDTLQPMATLVANAAAGQPSVQVAAGAGAAYAVGQRLNVCGGLTVAAGAEADREDQQKVIASITPGVTDTITFTTNLNNAYTFSASAALSDGYGPYAAPGAYITPWQTGTTTIAGRPLTEEDQQNGIHLIRCDRFAVGDCAIFGVWESPIRMGTHVLNGTAQYDGCTNATINGNVLYHGYDQGVGAWCSTNITIANNVVSAAGWAGVSLTMSDACTVVGNVCADNVQRIPADTKSGQGIAIEGGRGNTISGNRLSNNYGPGVLLTAAGTFPFGGPAQQATTVAAGSNNVALPAATVNVASTAAFAASGSFTVLSSAGAQQVIYTGKTATSFTGCSLGVGTLFTNQRVVQYGVFLNNGAALQVASTTATVSDGTLFQLGGHYSIIDGPRTERIDVTGIVGNVLTLANPTSYRHLDRLQIGQAVPDGNTVIGNTIQGGTQPGIKLAGAVRTLIYANIIDQVGLNGIDGVNWAAGGVQPPSGTVVSGNVITAPDTTGDGAAYQAIAFQQCSDLTISSNRCGGALATTGYFNALHLQGVTDSVVAQNTVADAYATGIRIDEAQDWVSRRISVTGNAVLRCYGEGILLYGGLDLSVEGNIVSGCAANSGPGGFGGAVDVRGVQQSVFAANIIVDNGHGGLGLDDASINGVTVTTSGNQILNNIASDDGKNRDAFTGAPTQQGFGIKELAAGQGPNTYSGNITTGNITNLDITSLGNSYLLISTNNLSDVAVPATALTNLGGVPTARTLTAGTGLTGGGTLAADRTFTVAYGTAAGTATQGNDTRVVNAVQTSRTLTAGTGLTGGGDLSANRTFTVAYGTAASTATEGNDTRVVNAVQTSRTLTAGTGLTGGGDLSANRTFTVSYGTTAGTAAQGDDSRFGSAGDGLPRASDSGYVVWSGPLYLHNNSLVPTTHFYNLGTMRAGAATAANSVNVHFQGAGTAVTDFRVGIYGPTGVLLAKTGNGSATVGVGVKQFALTSAATIAAGKLFFVIWGIATVMPTITATTNSNGAAAQNDPTPAGTQVRVTGSVTDGGAGTDVPGSLTVAGGGNVTAPAFAQTGQQMWVGLVA